MMRHSLVVGTLLAVLLAGCGRGNRAEGRANEQQSSDLNDAAALVEGNQTIDLPGDSLTVNESDADATLNGAAPPPAPPVANTNAPPVNGAAAVANSPAPENGAANPAPTR
jgi:uncharacterized lipoprotein